MTHPLKHVALHNIKTMDGNACYAEGQRKRLCADCIENTIRAWKNGWYDTI